ncbi:hypothetical protein BCV02_05025 [Vibrio breoganii]|uniref:glycosyltransferase n=1 Tax=Vibrio breoganii TaxID=553239 RepID=UPI000C866A83|nr:glycosyltransferase [Vibrio breoganii]PMG05088.1 hypothetical protein BCV02_05025 [Vibrio breoganii]
MKKQKCIKIVQPAVPEYRLPFYEYLNDLISINLEIYHAKKDFLGVESKNSKFSKIIGDFVKIGPFYWHKGLKNINLSNNDILVLPGNPRVINYMVLLFYCKLVGIKVIWWGQGWTAGSYGLSASIRRNLMMLADAVAVYTEDESTDIQHSNVIGLNNGLEINKYCNNVDPSELSNITLSLLFIGRLTEKAELEFLLRTLSQVKSVKFHLDVIGDGPLNAPLKEMARDLGLERCVTWYGAIFDDKKIAQIAMKNHLFVYPGSVGLSVIHAFNLYLPALVHDDARYHMPEFAAVKPGFNAFTYKRRDESSLIAVIENIKIEDLVGMKSNAHNTILTTFNAKDMAKRFNILLSKVINA